MTRHLSQIRSSPARSRIQCRKNGFSKIHGKRTISITKRKIIRAIHDRDGFGIIHCGSRGGGEGEEFSKSGGAFGGFGEVENGWVEAGSAEEADLGRDGAGGDEVVGWDGGEAVGGVVGGEGEVKREEEGGDGGAVARETGEDCGVYWRDLVSLTKLLREEEEEKNIPRSAGYCEVMAWVMMLPKECPTPTTFEK